MEEKEIFLRRRVNVSLRHRQENKFSPADAAAWLYTEEKLSRPSQVRTVAVLVVNYSKNMLFIGKNIGQHPPTATLLIGILLFSGYALVMASASQNANVLPPNDLDSTSSESDDEPVVPTAKAAKLTTVLAELLAKESKKLNRPAAEVAAPPDCDPGLFAKWTELFQKHAPEDPVEMGVSDSVLRRARRGKYVDYRQLAPIAGATTPSATDEYKIYQGQWFAAHSKYMRIVGERDPALFIDLLNYQSIICDLAKDSWYLAANYDKIFREARSSASLTPDQRAMRYPWAAQHPRSFQAARAAVERAHQHRQVRAQGQPFSRAPSRGVRGQRGGRYQSSSRFQGATRGSRAH